jgi:hypothetical protein
VLVLLNGPPASGKSTIAQRFVDSRPLSLNLDIDVVRSMLGGWLNDPSTAGLTARSLALVMAESHLAAGCDVIVPQFLGRPDFIEQLAGVANRSAAPSWRPRCGSTDQERSLRSPNVEQHRALKLITTRQRWSTARIMPTRWARCTTRSCESSSSDLPPGGSRSSRATSTRPSRASRTHSISAPSNPLRSGVSAARFGPSRDARTQGPSRAHHGTCRRWEQSSPTGPRRMRLATPSWTFRVCRPQDPTSGPIRVVAWRSDSNPLTLAEITYC